MLWEEYIIDNSVINGNSGRALSSTARNGRQSVAQWKRRRTINNQSQVNRTASRRAFAPQRPIFRTPTPRRVQGESKTASLSVGRSSSGALCH